MITRVAFSRDLPGLTWLDHKSDANAKPGQHIDQCIGTEQVDASAQEITNARLRDSKRLRRFSLLQAL